MFFFNLGVKKVICGNFNISFLNEFKNCISKGKTLFQRLSSGCFSSPTYGCQAITFLSLALQNTSSAFNHEKMRFDDFLLNRNFPYLLAFISRQEEILQITTRIHSIAFEKGFSAFLQCKCLASIMFLGNTTRRLMSNSPPFG